MVERCILTDGTEVGRDGWDHNSEHKQQFDGGMWAGPNHEGTVYLVDCEVAHWSDNGLYASRTNGGIVVSGGKYYNSSISNVRISHEDSFVGGHAWIEIDTSKIPQQNNGDELALTRGIWLEPGGVTGNGPPVIGSVFGRLGPEYNSVSGFVEVGRAMGRVEIPGPINVELDGSDDPAIYARQPDGGAHPTPPEPHDIPMNAVTVTGSGSTSQAVIHVLERPGSSVDGSCIEVTGADTDGIRFANGDGSVSDTNVNVTGTAVFGATTTNVTTDGSCTLDSPPENDNGGENDNGDENGDPNCNLPFLP